MTDHEYRVPSQYNGGIYNVCLKPGADDCSCPDFARYGGRAEIEPGEFYCKHLFAALMVFIKSAHVSARTDDCSRKEAA
ncbi:MAG: SWIM zinc finger family protein [Rubrobacter sp.]|nr:SWIM zinc finger family protein [Rubrobacter sp.]